MPQPVKITAELTEAEAMALAQFHKRIGWRELRTNAVDDAEAYLMRDASEKLRAALAEKGYSPR